MPNQSTSLDDVFQALSDATRRAVLERLRRGPASTGELARPFGMALPSFTQHLHTLEACGLVRSRKAGRVRTYELVPRTLRAPEHWLEQQRSVWETRLDQLDNLLMERKAKG